MSVAELWESEKSFFLPFPATDFAACSTHLVKPNPYSQVEFETNRYSVPVAYRNMPLVLEAYPFHVRLMSEQGVVVEHPRCFGREQDIIDPLLFVVAGTVSRGNFLSRHQICKLRIRF